MTALETRLDTILPTLATKADVEAVRAAVDTLTMSTNAQFGELRAELRAEFRGELGKATLSTDTKLGELRAELGKASLRTDAKLGELRADTHKMNAEIKSWTLATMITIVGTMLAAIFGISQIYKGAAPASPAAQPAPIIITIPGAFAPAAPAGTK